MIDVPLSHILIFSTILFFIGAYGFLTRKNMITMLISVELILNAVNINFVSINKYLFPEHLEGHFFALFVIGIAAAEAGPELDDVVAVPPEGPRIAWHHRRHEAFARARPLHAEDRSRKV